MRFLPLPVVARTAHNAGSQSILLSDKRYGLRYQALSRTNQPDADLSATTSI